MTAVTFQFSAPVSTRDARGADITISAVLVDGKAVGRMAMYLDTSEYQFVVGREASPVFASRKRALGAMNYAVARAAKNNS